MKTTELLFIFAVGTLWCFTLLWIQMEFRRSRDRAVKESQVLREELKSHRARLEELGGELRNWIGSLDSELRSRERARPAPAEGWSRARAIEAVRAGLAPDDASRLLGVPKREMRLISEIVALGIED